MEKNSQKSWYGVHERPDYYGIDKVEKITLEKDNSFYDIDPVRLHVYNMDMVNGYVQNDETYDYFDDQHFRDKYNIPANNNDEEYETSPDEDLDDAPEST